MRKSMKVDAIDSDHLTNTPPDKLHERKAYTHRMVEIIDQELYRCGIQVCVHARAKHIYNTYRKIHQKSSLFEGILDPIGIRVLVQTDADCYRVLGALHNKWDHISDRLKDFIGLSKANGSRSLDTTIRDGRRRVEIQILTFEMRDLAE